ncbi:MAG: DUF3313 family protein [Campylobacterales bacterium]|nr:DUF3313 family protein [Campylobacterales bacterium]
MKITTSFLALALTALVSGCASQPLHQNRSGFLGSYAFSAQAVSDRTYYFETLEGADLSAYEKILVPDIKVLPNTKRQSSQENILYEQISSYASAAYRQNIIKNSSNYTLVDVAQVDTMIIEIALSMVEVHDDDKEWDNLSALALSLNPQTFMRYQEGDARLLVEARISDAISGKVLARSMRIVMEEKVSLHSDKLQFQDLQPALDRWLNEAMIKH